MVDSGLGKKHLLDNYNVPVENVAVVPFIAPYYIREHGLSVKKAPLVK